ncbi:MAG: response regulator [Flavobacteriales bacterium]|nr:response regulator [Flavobacteriales bacterium]
MYTAIILDDEEKGRNSLNKFLTEYCPEIDIVGVASSGEQAHEIISKLRPQVLFFDIEIAQASSKYNTTFDLLPSLPKYNYEVVFVTAYEHYALRAIRSHAIGYVLKPISITDLIECVNGVVERLRSSSTPERLEELVRQIRTEEHTPKRI